MSTKPIKMVQYIVGIGDGTNIQFYGQSAKTGKVYKMKAVSLFLPLEDAMTVVEDLVGAIEQATSLADLFEATRGEDGSRLTG